MSSLEEDNILSVAEYTPYCTYELFAGRDTSSPRGSRLGDIRVSYEPLNDETFEPWINSPSHHRLNKGIIDPNVHMRPRLFIQYIVLQPTATADGMKEGKERRLDQKLSRARRVYPSSLQYIA